MIERFHPPLSSAQSDQLLGISVRLITATTGIGGFNALPDEQKTVLIEKAQSLARDVFCAITPGTFWIPVNQ